MPSVRSAYTEEEVAAQFMATVEALADYWARTGKDKHDAVDGIIHSVLCILDGCNMALPGFVLTVAEQEGEPGISGAHRFKPGTRLADYVPLHELWAARRREKQLEEA